MGTIEQKALCMFDLIKSIAVDRKNSLPVADLHARYRKTGTPVVFGDLCQRWPATERWTPEYLSENSSDFDVSIYSNVMKINRGWPFKPIAKLGFKGFLEDVLPEENDFRISQIDVEGSLNWLNREFSYPRLGFDFNSYRTAISIGGKRAEEPMRQASNDTHTVMCNFGDQVSVLLVPPVQSGFMYRVGHSKNTVRDIDFKQPEFEKYPALKNIFAYVADLSHGDSLYVPAGFWYNVVHHGVSIRLSFQAEKGGLIKRAVKKGITEFNKLIDVSSLSEHRLNAMEREVVIRTNSLLDKSGRN